jgi:hypothetical protein
MAAGCVALGAARGATEFVCTLKQSGGDYSYIVTWEAAIKCDLTATGTKVFSHGGITGTIADGTAVTGAISGAAGTATHVTATQILIKTITGTFQSGEQVYKTANVDYVTLSTAGDSAIAVLECYKAGWETTGHTLSSSLTIDGWTASAANYIVIRTPPSERHTGIPKSGGNYTGFALKIGATGLKLHVIEDYVRLEGLIVDDPIGGKGKATLFFESNVNRVKGNVTDDCIVIRTMFDTGSTITISPNDGGTVRNTLVIGGTRGIDMYKWVELDIYNCTIIDCVTGIYELSDVNFYNLNCKNNLFYGCTTPITHNTYRDTDLELAGYDYNATEDASLPGPSANHNRVGKTFAFAAADIGDGDKYDDDFHLTAADGGARDFGTNLSGTGFGDDMDGDSRPGGSAWDIGMDEFLPSASGTVITVY